MPRGYGLVDWYVEMIDEAIKVQQNVLAVRRAEGELDYEGSSFSSSLTSGVNTSRGNDNMSNNLPYNQQRVDTPNKLTGGGGGYSSGGFGNNRDTRHENQARVSFDDARNQGSPPYTPSTPQNDYNRSDYNRPPPYQPSPSPYQPLPFQQNDQTNSGTRYSSYNGEGPVSTGDSRIQKVGYDKWMQPGGFLDDGKPYYNCQACNMLKARHRPEFCPAIKTGCPFANHEWRTVTWERSPGGRQAKTEGWTYAPKLNEQGQLPAKGAWQRSPSQGSGGRGDNRAGGARPNDNRHDNRHRSPGNGPGNYQPPPFAPVGAGGGGFRNQNPNDAGVAQDGKNQGNNNGECVITDNKPTMDWDDYMLQREESMIQNLNSPECTTDLIIFSYQNDPLFSQVTARRSPGLSVRTPSLKLSTLVDTGANLSFVTVSLSERIEKYFLGIRGIGNYKVTDAFLKAHYFRDNISFRIRLNTGNPRVDSKSWIIKAVIVDIDFTSDFLLGLNDIKMIKLFRYVPECVEDSTQGGDESSEENAEPGRMISPNDYIIEIDSNDNRNVQDSDTRVMNLESCNDNSTQDTNPGQSDNKNEQGIWGEGWNEEERIRRGKEAYAREEIAEVDYNLVEAIPTDALDDEPEIKLPEKIFGPETLRRSTRRLIEKFIRVFSKRLRKEAAKVTPLRQKESIYSSRTGRET